MNWRGIIMRIGFWWAASLAMLTPCAAAGTDTLEIGGMELNSWHIGKWFVSCTTDKTENKSTCGAELNAYDLPEPKNVDFYFVMNANRVDIHVTVIRGACVSYIRIDPPHLRMNPATAIEWRGEKMRAPYAMKHFRDMAGQRLFLDDETLSLQRTIEEEGPLYIKTLGANKEASFSVSTKGYKRVCQTVLAKEHEMNSAR